MKPSVKASCKMINGHADIIQLNLHNSNEKIQNLFVNNRTKDACDITLSIDDK